MSERVGRSGVQRLRVAAVVMLVMVAAGAGAGRASAAVSNASVSFTGSAQAGASPAWVNITFTTPHALSYSSGDTITIQAPQGTRWAAGEDYVVSNGFTECGIVYSDSPSVSPTGETVTIPAGNSACGNWGAGSTLTVSASNSTNPTVASPDYTMAVSTSRDPTPVASSPYTISPGPPSYLSTPGQNLYRGEVGANYNAPASGNARMQVIVADKYGNPTDTSGVKVTFTAPDSGPSGTFLDGTKSETVTTDASGTATADAFTANDIAVPGALYTVEATGSLPAGGPLNPGYFYYVQLPGPTARAVLLLSPPLVRADGSSTATATATVTDRFGNRISGDHFNTAGTEQFTERVGLASDGGQAISAVTNNRDGTYTATLTSIRTPEDSTITATAQDTPSSSAFTGSATLRRALPPA